MCPCLQIVQRIPLGTMTVSIHSDKVYTREGVPISVNGVAQVKICGEKPHLEAESKDMLRKAAELFGDMEIREIQEGMYLL